MTYHMMIAQWSYWSDFREETPRIYEIYEESCTFVGEGPGSWGRWNNIISVFEL